MEQIRNVRPDGHPVLMWLVQVICTGPDCADEIELIVDDLEEVERAVCACEHGVVVLSVSHFEPLHLAAA
jgi:hypothetical protein